MATENTKKSPKGALKNISLESFEQRVQKLNVSYKTAVLAENRQLKDHMESFDFIKDSIKEFLKNENHSMDLSRDVIKTSESEMAVLYRYRQQCLSILGRLTFQNYKEMGVRVSKTGRVSAFYILQYLYEYCKTYQAKQEKKETTKK